MRYLRNLLIVAFVVMTISVVAMAQATRRTDDPRNLAPTVGSGGSVGGPTGLFTVIDGQTLRAGEYTFSVAYSNYDRDPGNVDIVEVPLSFQVGVNNYLELFINTDAYRAIKVNSPRNLSGFYLPNSQFQIGTTRTSAPAIVLAPTGANFGNGAFFRPQGRQNFVSFPFLGGTVGGANNLNFQIGLPRNTTGNGASQFPGLGSPLGGILPGIVLSTTPVGSGNSVGTNLNAFTLAPSYLPDAPLLNRQYGESSFNTFTIGGKIRFTKPNSPLGLALVPFYRFYSDANNGAGGFNMLQRGASPGGSRGDIGLILVGDARVSRNLNFSANLGYIRNSSIKAEFPPNGDEFTLLDRGDELTGALGVDIPVNQYFQAIGEFRATRYTGGRTPNAFEQDPIDGLVGVRFFPQRYLSVGMSYRYNFNQQDKDVFEDSGLTTPNGVPSGFPLSDDPNGFIFQFTAGRRNARREPSKPNTPGTINSVNLSDEEIKLGCEPGFIPRSGETCPDNTSITVTTNASDVDGDQLLYQYSVSGGKIVGTGNSVSWDLSGVQQGTYTLSVGVDDGCGTCGTPTTRNVRVVACDCVPEVPPTPPCPTDLTVTAEPGQVEAGEVVTFRSTVNLNGTSPTYNWSVSSLGTIESGQGTDTITVRTATANASGQDVTATLNLGNVDPSCPATASARAQFNTVLTPTLVDEYEDIKNDDLKARNDNIITRLQEDPSQSILIIGYASRRGGNREAQRRLNYIVRDMTTRLGIDASRIRTINGGTTASGNPRTEIYLVPSSATDPAPRPENY